MDSDPRDRYLIARGSDAHQLALMGSLPHPPGNSLVPFSHTVLERYAQVGKGGTLHRDELCQTFDADDIFVGFVEDEVVRVHLCEGIFEGIQGSLDNDLPGTAG